MNLLINTPPLTVFEHMALDECLVHHPKYATLLRFYSWKEASAVTYGYAQFYQEVQRSLKESSFVGNFTRRPTGGGVVFHKNDLTFSLIFQTKDSPSSIYAKLHGFIYEGLQSVGKKLSLMPKVAASEYTPSINHSASACFIRPVENDLLTGDKKILGGAIRRFENSVLYQGSLQLDDARINPIYKTVIINAVRSFLGQDLVPSKIEDALLANARTLATNQYQSNSWIQKF